jgi:hypothetical protein
MSDAVTSAWMLAQPKINHEVTTCLGLDCANARAPILMPRIPWVNESRGRHTKVTFDDDHCLICHTRKSWIGTDVLLTI